ncbi:MAG TPA: HD domain-containing phosphohydrolase [Gemmatimonadaceae bacterium]|nr:HD domain-containing phosphohydrolase [Gemmatimonadaceae bacterium]
MLAIPTPAPARNSRPVAVAGASDHREPTTPAPAAAPGPRHLGIGVAEALINAMEAKDPYLRGHSQRVADVAGAIAETLGLDAATVEDIRLAGRLHDVGKIGIRESILNKPDVLTPDEIRHVREHVRIGVEILSPLPSLGPVLQYVHDHHERYDGCGYPRGLAGEAISLGGRILAAADAFDALTSLRAYRDPLSPEACLSRLAGDAGRALDPRVFAALRHVVAGEAPQRPEPVVARGVYVSIV